MTLTDRFLTGLDTVALPLDQYLVPVSSQSPCGENDYDFRDLGGILSSSLESITGDPDGGMVAGEKAPQGTGEWAGLLASVGGYFGRTKHLGLARFALIADLHLSGLPGLADGLLLFNRLLSTYWDEVHPRIEDGHFEERLEVISGIEDSLVMKGIGAVTVAKGRRAGNYTLDQVLTSKSGGEPGAGLVSASINETLSEDPEFYENLAAQIREVRQQIGFLNDKLQEHLGSPSLSFRGIEDRLCQLESVLSQTAIVTQTAAVIGATVMEDSASPAAETAPGEIRSRADVCRQIEQVIRFYHKTEPTSPVPHLLSRVKRVVNMNFMEILEEFKLSGTPPIEHVIGPADQESLT